MAAMEPSRSHPSRRPLLLCLLAVAVLTIGQTTQPAEVEPIAAEATASPATAPSLGPGVPSGANVAIVRIEGLIYDFTLESLQRRVDRAIDEGASMIVLELDTPGGVVTSALKISKYLKSLQVPTVAWVNTEAYSAGIMIASACDAIVMAPASATGDCAPIVPGTDLEPTERAKALSPILAEFRDSARANDYDYVLFHAMCVLGVEVFEIEHKQTGDRRMVNAIDYRVMVDGMSLQAAAQQRTGLFGLGKPTTPDPGAPSLDEATEADRGQWTFIRKVHDGATLLTLPQSEAVEVGLAKSDKIRTVTDLKTFLGAASITRVGQTWSEDLAGWLTSPAVRAILILALLLGAYVEFQTPGLGAAGAVAMIALIALIGAPFLVGLAEIWHLVIFFVGFLLLLVEVFVTPGFGVLGVSGLVLMLAGLILSIVPTTGQGWMPLPARATMDVLRASAAWTLVGLIASLLGFYFLTKYFSNIPILNRLVLTAAQPAGAGATTTAVSGDDAVGSGEIAVGDRGTTLSPLRPTGRASFGDHQIDVVSAGQWIQAGQAVRVVEIHGNRIVVDLAEPATA